MNAITKKRNLAEDTHLPYIFSILNKYDLDFIPKIIEWDNEGYTYEYVVGKKYLSKRYIKNKNGFR